MSRGWNEQPRWVWALIAVAAVALAVLLPLAWNRGTLSVAEVQRLAAEASAEAEPDAAAEPPSVAFLGDSYMGGSGMDSGDGHQWPDLVSKQRHWREMDFAVGGTGYTTAGDQPGGSRFMDRVPAIVEARPDMVIVGGGANDADAPAEEFRTAVDEVLGALSSQLPDAQLVVLSPFWRGDPPDEVLSQRDQVRAAAERAGAAFIDVTGVFAGESQALIGSDGIHPTDEGHRHIADVLAPRLPDSLT